MFLNIDELPENLVFLQVACGDCGKPLRFILQAEPSHYEAALNVRISRLNWSSGERIMCRCGVVNEVEIHRLAGEEKPSVATVAATVHGR